MVLILVAVTDRLEQSGLSIRASFRWAKPRDVSIDRISEF